MAKISSIFFLISLFTFSTTSIFPQRSNTLEMKKIESYRKTVDKFVRRTNSPDLIFADVSDYLEGSKPRWQKFNSEKVLEKFRETTETYSIALNWRRNGRIVASNFTLFSPSGDWSKYVFHYFREDGTLAKVKSELRTFYGDYIVIEDRYLDSRGRSVSNSVKYLDLRTNKPKKPTKDFLGNNPVFSQNDYFKKTAKLPFYHLIKK